jgi:enoyl-CoA hydratase/carnithine racemase
VAVADEMAANAPLSILAAKKCIDAFVDAANDADLAPLDGYVERCFKSADYVEGRRAFMEKRKARFQGQ